MTTLTLPLASLLPREAIAVANSSHNEENSSHNENLVRDESFLDEDLWAKLSELAEPIRRTRRVSDRTQMERAILKLCDQPPLNTHQLATLLGRSSASLRNNYLSPLVKSGRLLLKHPERPNHPQQAYYC
jgi:ATP-dependent DNA helicase RecG